MRAIRRSWANLNRLERAGYAALIILLLILVAVRSALGWIVGPPRANVAEEKALAEAWAAFVATHPVIEEGVASASGNEVPNLSAEPFPFDPNSLDSVGFRRLGLTQKAVKGLMSWRRGGMVFRKPEDLSRLYNLPPEQYERLKPFIRIDPSLSGGGRKTAFGEWKRTYTPPPETVDLNTVDSATLVRLPAIGPTLAHRILAYRDALGGFFDHRQLLEVYRFPDSTMDLLRPKLVLRAEAVRMLDINTASRAQLLTHPYIGEKMADHILRFREALGRFTAIDQLRQVPLMDAARFRKMAPYLRL